MLQNDDFQSIICQHGLFGVVTEVILNRLLSHTAYGLVNYHTDANPFSVSPPHLLVTIMKPFIFGNSLNNLIKILVITISLLSGYERYFQRKLPLTIPC